MDLAVKCNLKTLKYSHDGHLFKSLDGLVHQNIRTRYIFQRVFFLGKISAILPICIMKKSIWKFLVNGFVSVTRTRVNIDQIS